MTGPARRPGGRCDQSVRRPEPNVPPSERELPAEPGDEVDGDHPQRSARTRRMWLVVAVLAVAAIAIVSSSPGRPSAAGDPRRVSGHAARVV